MEIPRRNGLKNLRLDKSTTSSKLVWEPRRIKKPSLTGCTSKDHQQWWYRYDPTWLAIVTGICVKVWQSKSGTGHDEEGNSLKANNLRKLASKALTNSKRLTRKKHHQPMELNSGIARSNMRFGYHSSKKEAELSASFLFSGSLFMDNKKRPLVT